MKKEERRLSLAAGLVVSSLAVTAPAFAEGEVVFSSWGVVSGCLTLSNVRARSKQAEYNC